MFCEIKKIREWLSWFQTKNKWVVKSISEILRKKCPTNAEILPPFRRGKQSFLLNFPVFLPELPHFPWHEHRKLDSGALCELFHKFSQMSDFSCSVWRRHYFRRHIQRCKSGRQKVVWEPVEFRHGSLQSTNSGPWMKWTILFCCHLKISG